MRAVAVFPACAAPCYNTYIYTIHASIPSARTELELQDWLTRCTCMSVQKEYSQIAKQGCAFAYVSVTRLHPSDVPS